MIVCSHYLILKGSKALSQLLSPSEKPAGDNKRPTSYTQNRGVGSHGGKWPSSILLYQAQRGKTYQMCIFYDWPSKVTNIPTPLQYTVTHTNRDRRSSIRCGGVCPLSTVQSELSQEKALLELRTNLLLACLTYSPFRLQPARARLRRHWHSKYYKVGKLILHRC